MAGRPPASKLYPILTNLSEISGARSLGVVLVLVCAGDIRMAAGLAMAMFVALVGFGSNYFGWSDPSGKVQLALITSFILGCVASYKERG